MALSDTMHYLLLGIAGSSSLSLWTIVVASIVFYFTTLYIRKRREYQIYHQKLRLYDLTLISCRRCFWRPAWLSTCGNCITLQMASRLGHIEATIRCIARSANSLISVTVHWKNAQHEATSSWKCRLHDDRPKKRRGHTLHQFWGCE